MGGEGELVQHVFLQRAEAPAEGHLLRRRNALLAEHQHVVLQQRPADALEVRLGNGPGEVETDQFGAQRRAEAADLEILPGRRSGASSGESSVHGVLRRGASGKWIDVNSTLRK